MSNNRILPSLPVPESLKPFKYKYELKDSKVMRIQFLCNYHQMAC